MHTTTAKPYNPCMSKQKKKPQAHQLRIIGGQWRGRKLAIANIPGLRPTGDRIRETLFNWLMADLPDSHCMDLFAGSGALGFEALSRGAAKAILFEQHPQAAELLKAHSKTLHCEQAEIRQENCFQWLQTSPLNKHSINIVFIDPPFAENLWQSTLDLLDKSELLAADAKVYIEGPKDQAIITPEDWELLRSKTAGGVYYQLFTVGHHNPKIDLEFGPTNTWPKQPLPHGES